ncbi:lipoprotein-anchoring transpeptidase ErfK/SrfK [Kutzneria viridogrisea]|uniref:Lipoprotein-anchoring transpeptidase ErfK/SrfK n=1 Tax=Kutzneria viridogrisea TaxID=47990 RepID=A0ABR6BXS3_9PSEU|nr:Ig-like domain-containing protein [Kutzneria albida]MBA8931705.1 lipoprotein-anchoring transpeptidase ErfK/SrfK [Kutzneria viridogrisea]
MTGAALLLTACSGGAGTPQTPTKPPAPPAKLTSAIADGSKDITVNTKLTLTASDGKVGEVKLVGKSGTPVEGRPSDDGKTWTSTGRLEFGETYSYEGKALNADGKATELRGSFSTVAPGTLVRGMLNIDDNGTVGIAAPIIIQFAGHVEDRVAAEKALSVKSEPATTGAWGWLPDNDTGSRVHWRPQNYWAPNTKVTVTANLYGVPYGQGRYGKDDVTSTFTIGRSQIVKADVNTHRMTVIRDGAEVASYDASMGSGASQDRVTRSGIHVVTEKWEDKVMSNPPYYTDARERWAVRISNNGEFIHANPNTIGNQGNSNVTHGCINLSTANAQEYFGTAIFGDPVEVTGSSVALSSADGDIYDWALDWGQWQALSALR